MVIIQIKNNNIFKLLPKGGSINMEQKSKSILIISIAAFSLIFGTFGCQAADKTVNETKPVGKKVPEKKEEEVLNSLIKNGNFVQNTDYWTFGANVGNAGGAATATVEDGVLRIDIGSPGSATYAIQLIQAPIEIIYGLRYRVSFDAKASGDSAIEVKVGGVENRGWADYTNGESVGGTIVYLTTQMENHSIEFGMEEMTDPKARLEFQLGNISTSSIWLDNIKVEVIGKNTGKSVDPTLWVPNPNKIIIPKIKNRGAKLPFIQYEAENAATNGVILGPNRKFKEIPNEASNKMAVNLDSTGDYVEFTLKEKTNSLI
ncbi:MAG: carbohydrate binding domain-containing protein, partial [candidate division Zixibacteria bacterium]|nr:carbohydrate binding domain-containing protein [candidate division Zixibacteria bacterium]